MYSVYWPINRDVCVWVGNSLQRLKPASASLTEPSEEQQYRSRGSRWDVEERNSIFGTLGNHVILWQRSKRLQVHQHLVGLVDTERANMVV